MAEIKAEHLMYYQYLLQLEASKLYTTTDPDEMVAIGNTLAEKGKELDQLAKAFERQEQAKLGPPRHPKVEVVLTLPQKQRVFAQTGIWLESIFIPDEVGTMTTIMPLTQPAAIEARALEEAKARLASYYAWQATQQELDQAVYAIENAESPEAAELLAELRADPSFMNGMLYKPKG